MRVCFCGRHGSGCELKSGRVCAPADGLQPMMDVPIYGRIATMELFKPPFEAGRAFSDSTTSVAQVELKRGRVARPGCREEEAAGGGVRVQWYTTSKQSGCAQQSGAQARRQDAASVHG